MDLRTGKRYTSLADAQADGVPDCDIAYVVDGPEGMTADQRIAGEPIIIFRTGPFKGREYKRDPLTRNLVRVS